MDILIVILISIIIIIGFWFWFRWRAQYKIQEYEQKNIYSAEQYYSKINQEQKDKWLSDVQQAREQYRIESLKLENEINQLNNEIKKNSQFNQNLIEVREKAIDSMIETKQAAAERLFNAQVIQRNKELEEWTRSAQEAANFKAAQERKLIEEETQQKIGELDAYRAKVDAANKEILRRRALEEKQEFYSIQIPESTKRDINLLNSIRQNFSKIDILDKLIYDSCIKKSADEMIKRVLEGRAPSGIYKITRLKTGEVYIGQSVDVKARWQQHTKSAFHCGTISHSILHTTMEKDGIDSFTWELLEEVEKDKLREREHYWIDFYNSTTYGLNERR